MQAGGSLALSIELTNAEKLKKDSKITKDKNRADDVGMHRKKYTDIEQNS
jgi:hypothetical protein